MRNEMRRGSIKPFAVIGSLLAILVLWMIHSGGRSATETVEQFIHASLTADAKTMISLVPKDLIASAAEYDIIESKSSLIKDTQRIADIAKKSRDEKYGTSWRYTFEIAQSHIYSDDELAAYVYDYDKWRESIEEAMDVSVIVVIEDDEIINMTMTLLKIGRKWYVDYLY